MRQMLCPVLVGRERELEALHASLEAARTGRGAVVLLVAEAGMGKSRLAREVSTLATEMGMQTLAGRAVSRAVPVPLRPLVEAFQPVSGSVRPSGALAAFRGAVGRLIPQLAEGGAPAEVNHLVLGEATTRLLALAAGDRGSLLLLEDLHWADMETLDVVEYLSDHLATEPVLCVGTIRAGEESPAEGVAQALGQRRAATVLDVERLGASDIDRVAAACLAQPELPVPLRQFIRSRSEGVPFLIEELLAGLLEAKALVPDDGGGWRVVSRLVPAVPLTFAETVHRRLEALDATAQTVVRAAALLGSRFDWSLLPTITELAEGSVLAGLKAAAAVQLVEPDPETGGFRFRHALSRDVVLAGLLPPESTRIAARALDAVLAVNPELPDESCELAAELAEHARDGDRAARFHLESARRALRQGAAATAEVALNRARRLTAPGGPMALDIEEGLAQAAALAGQIDWAVELAAGVLAAVGPEPDSRQRRARLHVLLGRAAVTRGRWDVAAHQATQARTAAVGSGDQAVICAALALAAQAAIAQGALGEATDQARLALSGAEEAGAPEAACEALEVLGRVARLSDIAEAEAYFQRAREVAERHHLLLWRARALHELGTIDLYTNLDRDRLHAAREAAVDAGAVATVALVDLHLASMGTARWDPDEAIPPAERCVDTSHRLGLSTLGMGLLHLSVAHAQAGNEPEADRIAQRARAEAGDELDVVAGIPGRVHLHVALRRADFVAARQALDEAMTLLERDPSVFLPFRGMWALLRTVQDFDAAAARAAARAAVGAQVLWNRCNLTLADAVALGREGRKADAEAVFARAGEDLAQSPAVTVWRAIALRIVAEAALEDAWGGPAVWLREALGTFSSKGFEELASSCRALLRAAGERVPRRRGGETAVPPPLGATGVTSRELDVLRLVAERLSNREIAERLHLSPRTVERHLANLFVKAGARNRRELAQLATRVGLGRT